ncbi:hypothetical protein ACELLULO517_27410 [Acidisoma cellulosilytica]|uniref:HNH endonuclease n=1 Tax=Acidisoma cellulosilyticum TaxID=2802395 RepID=A0A964E6W2_9PROT|nr:HNH endonuclease [Acidisoma cellulosilyticum]MCB8883996.1 hypothetical protein [Acidisoma cellulosilyticum]
MASEFSVKTIDMLSRRSALRCANPDCDKLTTGPNTDLNKSTNIGEAAHIYGANAGSARFRIEMSNIERAAISNGIWLCRDCHGLVDKDEQRFPVELLFLWKETHDAKITREIGKPGDLLRLNLIEKDMEDFKQLPPLVREIIKDKPEKWEYLLTVELLDSLLSPVLRKARYLRSSLLNDPLKRLEPEQFPNWSSDKMTEVTNSVETLKNLLGELVASWGPLGEPGDVKRIVHACELYARCANRLLQIAEETAFTIVPENFKSVPILLSESVLHVLSRFPEIPKFIRSILAEENPVGPYHYELVIDLPAGWAEKMVEAIESGRQVLIQNGRW